MPSRRSPWMNQELDDFRAMVRTFFAKELTPYIEESIANRQVDRDLWRKAGKQGILMPSIPEEYGGGGGDFSHEAVVIEEQARAGDSSWGNSVHSGIVAHYFLHYGSEELKQEWLPKMASGEAVAAIGMTEPGTGSDLQAIKTKAVKDGDDFVINGAKTFITNGYQSDVVVVACKTNPEEKAAGISLIVVPTDTEGFRRGRVLNKIGQKGQDTCELFFEDVRVPQSNLLGENEGEGFIQMMLQLPQERLIVALAAVAGMEFAVDETLTYVQEREAFGRPLFGFQNTKFKLAEVATETRVSRSFIDECVGLHIDGELDIQTAAMSKLWSTERACKVIDECLQLFGGYGYMEEYPISRAFTDMRVQRIYAGTSEIMKEIISRSLVEKK